ncbi:MAG: sensor histidine kinase [Solirubrobacteraceae bacterium]
MATSPPDPPPAPDAALHRVLAVLDRSPFGAAVSIDARAAAATVAETMLDACGATPGGPALALVAFATELLSAIAVQLAAEPEQAHRLVAALEAEAAVPRVALGRELLRGGGPAQAGARGIETRLALLRVFADAVAAALWTAGEDGEPRCIARSGALDHEPIAAMARALLETEAGQDALTPDGTALGLRIAPAHDPPAALLVHGIQGDPRSALLLAGEAAPNLARLLNRSALLRRRASERTVAEAVERRLARLRFDLHDGPQQDAHLLAQDLRLFSEQLGPLLVDHPDRERALGRVDDLEAQIAALDRELRRLSALVNQPAPRSTAEALAEIADSFRGRTGIAPAVSLTGELDRLTDSQRLAVLALVREALSNVRKHAEAERVLISVVAGAGGIAIRIEDDGAGFDPEPTRARAAGEGHLGLVGMQERVLMLGGELKLESRPGGPTVVSAALPQWPPDER